MSDEIFSRKRRHLARARARQPIGDSGWLLDRMAEDLTDRLGFLTHETQTALVIGHGAVQLRAALPDAATITECDLVAGSDVDIVADEDRLPFEPARFDLVLACGTLDSIDDLPGALILIRRALRPGGLFLGAMLGAGSLAQFRQIVQRADIDAGAAAGMRFHPQIEVRSAGDLLFRAGFSTPVADQDTIDVTYSSLTRLRADLSGAGARSALQQIAPLTRASYHLIRKAFDDAPVSEQFAPIFLTGWCPVAGEKRPAGPVKTPR